MSEQCKYCKKYFAHRRCTASTHGECDCPKCQGLCECKDEEPKLTVWFGAMPESNGKSNWTAILHKGDISDGFTIARSEYKDRVRYDADCVRYLIGELSERPWILDYDDKLIESAHIKPDEYESDDNMCPTPSPCSSPH